MTTNCSFALFDTAIGTCGIVWTSRGIAGVQVHNASKHATRASLLRRFPDAQETEPVPAVRRAIDGITALLSGQPSNLSDVTIDLDRVPEFNRKVYAVARTIPPGATLTYGEIAER